MKTKMIASRGMFYAIFFVVVIASRHTSAGALAIVTAGTNELPNRGEQESDGANFASASVSDPENSGTKAKAESAYLLGGSTLRIRAEATATELTKMGATEDIAFAQAIWSEEFTPRGRDGLPLPINSIMKVEYRLTGSLDGLAQIHFSEAVSDGPWSSITIGGPAGIEVGGFEPHFDPPSGKTTRVRLISRIPVPSSGVIPMTLDLMGEARANKFIQSSLVDYSQNSLDILAISVVDAFDQLIPGANVSSLSGTPYTILNAVPEPSTLVYFVIFTTIALIMNRKKVSGTFSTP